jgi:hypothetical protein
MELLVVVMVDHSVAASSLLRSIEVLMLRRSPGRSIEVWMMALSVAVMRSIGRWVGFLLRRLRCDRSMVAMLVAGVKLSNFA